MAKKDFRAVSQRQPHYPKPSHLTPSSLRKLGLAALGGLLLGGAATGVSRANAEESQGDSNAKAVRNDGKKPGARGPNHDATSARKGKPAKETSSPAQRPRFMPNGGRPSPRTVEVGAPSIPKPDQRKPSSPQKGSATDTGTDTSTNLLPSRGNVQRARVPEDEKTLPNSKNESEKTEAKKQPEPLPPPGAPPLPRNPAPLPLPKKSK